jgi:hypothetical protein
MARLSPTGRVPSSEREKSSGMAFRLGRDRSCDQPGSDRFPHWAGGHDTSGGTANRPASPLSADRKAADGRRPQDRHRPPHLRRRPVAERDRGRCRLRASGTARACAGEMDPQTAAGHAAGALSIGASSEPGGAARLIRAPPGPPSIPGAARLRRPARGFRSLPPVRLSLAGRDAGPDGTPALALCLRGKSVPAHLAADGDTPHAVIEAAEPSARAAAAAARLRARPAGRCGWRPAKER